jgi:hypothetical protein
MNFRSLAVVIGAVLVTTAISVQPTHAGEFARQHPRRAQVNRRERRQQGRIAQGVRSGRVSPQEAAKLEQQEAGIKQQERAEVQANGGYLTKGQQGQLNRELNQTSGQIYEDKHN